MTSQLEAVHFIICLLLSLCVIPLNGKVLMTFMAVITVGNSINSSRQLPTDYCGNGSGHTCHKCNVSFFSSFYSCNRLNVHLELHLITCVSPSAN